MKSESPEDRESQGAMGESSSSGTSVDGDVDSLRPSSSTKQKQTKKKKKKQNVENSRRHILRQAVKSGTLETQTHCEMVIDSIHAGGTTPIPPSHSGINVPNPSPERTSGTKTKSKKVPKSKSSSSLARSAEIENPSSSKNPFYKIGQWFIPNKYTAYRIDEHTEISKSAPKSFSVITQSKSSEQKTTEEILKEVSKALGLSGGQQGTMVNQGVSQKGQTELPMSENRPTAGQSVSDVSHEIKQVGKISFSTDTTSIIGRGADATVVFKGTLSLDGEEIKVAVKRIIKETMMSRNIETKEIRNLVNCGRHPNILYCFYYTTDDDYMYMALEYCLGTVRDLVEKDLQSRLPVKVTKRDLIGQTLAGVKHLHTLSEKLVHRDIKPTNILLHVGESCPPHTNVCVKLSDFGLSSLLQVGRSTFYTRRGSGTSGWMSPELLKITYKEEDCRQYKPTWRVDIHPLGCYFYYVLTDGKHPFGQRLVTRDSNVLDGEHSLHDLPDSALGWKNLISKMISVSPNDRPSAVDIEKHPELWQAQTKLDFIKGVCDLMVSSNCESTVDSNSESGSPSITENTSVVCLVERNAAEIFPDDWKSKLCDHLRKVANKNQPGYDGASVKGLLEFIRDQVDDYETSPEQIKRALGSKPDGISDYLTTRFPTLVWLTYTTIEPYRQHERLKTFFPEKFSFNGV